MSADCADPADYKARPLKNEAMLLSFPREDGDAFCKRFGRLCIEAPPKFQCVATQSFTAFANELLELSQFVRERFITAFFLQAHQKKNQIVLTTQ